MDLNNLGNANKFVKHLSKNPLVPWQRLVDLNLDNLVSKSEETSCIQKTYQATNSPHFLACNQNSKGVPENDRIHNRHGVDSELTKTATSKDEVELTDRFGEVEMHSEFKVAADIQCTSPVTAREFRNSGENCSGTLVQKSSAGVSVTDANNEGCCGLLEEAQQKQHWSFDKPDAIHSSSLLGIVENSSKEDLATQTEIYDNSIALESPIKTRSPKCVCRLNSFGDMINEDSGVATHEYTISSSKSTLINAETDLDYESDWDEISVAADDIEMCQSSDDNESDICGAQVLTGSRSKAADIELEDSRFGLSDNFSECRSLDANSFKENHAPIFNKNIIAKITSTQLVNDLDTNNVKNLNVESNLNTQETISLREFSPPNCSLSKSLHSMSREQCHVCNERCSSKSFNFKSASVDSLVPSGTCNEKMATVNKTDEFDSEELFETSHSDNKNEGCNNLGEINFSQAAQNKSQQKSVKVENLHFTEDVSVELCQRENTMKRFINNGRDESADRGCSQNEPQETRRSHEFYNYKQSKTLTRNPLTSWKHLVDENLESLAISNARSISYSDIDQDRLSISVKCQPNSKQGESLENPDLNSQSYGFKNIDSSLIRDYIYSEIFGERHQAIINQSDGALSCDCVVIDELRFGEPPDGLENSIDKTNVVYRETGGNYCDFLTLNGANSNQKHNETAAVPTQNQSANDLIACKVEGMREMAKGKEVSGNIVSETRLCGYQECSIEITGNNSESHTMPETQIQTSGEGCVLSLSMRNNYSNSITDQATIMTHSKPEHEYGNILLEATFDNHLLKVHLLPDTSRVTNDEPLGSSAANIAGKYERTHSKVRERRVNRSKPLTKRQCERCPKGVRAKSVETRDKYNSHAMKETSLHRMGSVDFPRPQMETTSSDNLDVIGTGWGKLTDFINRLVNVFIPSEQRYNHGEERYYSMMSNAIDTTNEVYSENMYSHTNKANLPHKQFQMDSHNLFENDYVFSTSEEQVPTEPCCQKRPRKKQRRRRESNLLPSKENTIESNKHSFPYVSKCELSSQYHQRGKGNMVQIKDTNTCVSDCSPTDYTFEMTPCVQDFNVWGWVHGGESNPSTSSALTRTFSYVDQKCIDDTGYVKVLVQRDIPNSDASVEYMSLGSVESVSGTGSRVSYNLKSRQAKTAVVLDTKRASNEKELSEFFTSNSAKTANHPTLVAGRKTHRNGIQEEVKPFPLIQDRPIAVNAAACSPMASSTRLSLLKQTLPHALRSARDVGTDNADKERSSTKQSQPRREMIEDNVDDEVAEVMTDDMLTSSLECLLEMLLQRGKVSQAFVTTVQGQVLAKSSGLLVTADDVSALVCCLTSNYQGVARVTLLTIAYQCFKLEQGSFLVGRADNSVFVARQGKQTIVVGFAQPSSPGSCIREIQELSLALSRRGL